MKRTLWIVCLAWSLATGTAHAGALKEIILNDGSRIKGEVVSMRNGVYTLKSGSLGKIRIKASRIRSITGLSASTPARGGAGSAATAAPATMQDLQTLASQLMSDPKIMLKIRSLQNSPQFKNLIKDPTVMQQLSTGDLESLKRNPKLKKLMHDPTVREISREIR